MSKISDEVLDKLLDQHYQSFKTRWGTGPEDGTDFTEAYGADREIFLNNLPKDE